LRLVGRQISYNKRSYDTTWRTRGKWLISRGGKDNESSC
jgi:hypothetical protein